MVKQSPSPKASNNQILKDIFINIKELVLNIESQTSSLITQLLKLSKYQKTSKAIENSYIILIISLAFQSLNPSQAIATSGITSIKSLFSELLTLHQAEKALTPTSTLFKNTQIILNSSASLLSVLNSKASPVFFHLCQLLQIYPTLSFETCLIILFKISQGVLKTSIFSYLTNEKIPFLPKQNQKKPTLVLDLDETLCHYNRKEILVRPGASDFIRSLSQKFELVIYTAATEVYANWALAVIDKDNLIQFRLYRQHLFSYKGKLVKDLRVLGREVDKVIIIDNEISNFRNQPENGIEIKAWRGESDDEELLRLGNLLLENWSGNKSSTQVVHEIKLS